MGDLLKWAGKSDPEGRRHPALFHMFDVGAVAARLWPLSPLRDLPPQERDALLMLLILHDLGKFSDAFQGQIERREAPPEYCRHWQLSYKLLKLLDGAVAELIGGTREARAIFYQATAGHHGDPAPSFRAGGPRDQTQLRAIGGGEEAAREALNLVAGLFPSASLEGVDEKRARRLSWLLSGLVTWADWIGSNAEWFPFPAPETSPERYWLRAQELAAQAVAAAGFGLSKPSDADPAQLVGGALRPMQRAVAELDLPVGPILALIEDATGSGKTEVALMLAQRMMAAGKARGLYFALPSMASSDAMFERMRPQLARLFEGRPSLALSHGRRDLHEGFASLRGNWNAPPEERSSDESCAPWIADDRRLSLMAEIGVGTIDQALMSVLPTRFHTLRMAALAGRVLIVDEAHDYDPYMQKQLEALLRFHAMFGGSAIVMTATLPADMRQAYAGAYLKGCDAGRMPELPEAYPALSVIGSVASAQAVEPVPASRRRVRVKPLKSQDEAVALLAEGAKAGAACLWVRNAVDDAIAAVEALRAAGVEAELLHARFAMCDRQQIEARMQARFGREGTGRAGPVLVATQIVQASLDLDFDVMVSDLAPMGDLIQRAGRLWRHERGARPVEGPVLHLLTPDPEKVENERWIFGLQPSGGWIYPVADLWRTARALLREGAIDAPDRLRALISEGYEGDAPEALQRAEWEAQGKRSAERDQALRNVLKAKGDEGFYGASQNYFDDREFPTRMGEAQVVLILMRREGEALRPWAEAHTAFRAMALSEVQFARRRYVQTALEEMQAAPEIARLRSGWKDWEREVRKIAIVGEDGVICDGLRYDAARGLIVEASQARG